MTVRSAITRITQQERVNFLLTNRLPRRWLTPVLVGATAQAVLIEIFLFTKW